MSWRRNRLGWLIVLALVTPLMVWVVPPASAGAVGVQLASPYGRDIWPGQKPSDLEVDTGRVTQNATATFRNLAGTVVRTMAVPPTCFFDACANDPGEYDGYEVKWDGKDNSGAFLPAGRYTGRIVLTDADGQQTASLGDLWVNHLVTRTRGGYQETWLDPAMNPFSTVGRCSSVLGPVPGTPYRIRLLSMNKCSSSAGTDDWAFRAQKLHFSEDDHVSRIVSVRIGAVGSPVHSGDMATLVVDSSAGTTSPPAWRRVAILDTAGAHVGTSFSPPSGTMTGHYDLLIQGRVVNGNRWRIHYYTASWTYRAWTR